MPRNKDDTERWLPLVGFEKLYAISTDGRFRSLPKQDTLGRNVPARILTNARLLKSHQHPHGGQVYLRIRLQKDGRQHDVVVHRLVLRTFVGEPLPGMQCSHINGNKLDNRLRNLEWVTSKENNRQKRVHDRMAQGERNGWARLTEVDVKRIWDSRLSAQILASELGLNRETVARVRRGETWGWFTKHLGTRPQGAVLKRRRGSLKETTR